jgi:hypothetical protein
VEAGGLVGWWARQQDMASLHSKAGWRVSVRLSVSVVEKITVTVPPRRCDFNASRRVCVSGAGRSCRYLQSRPVNNQLR